MQTICVPVGQRYLKRVHQLFNIAILELRQTHWNMNIVPQPVWIPSDPRPLSQAPFISTRPSFCSRPAILLLSTRCPWTFFLSSVRHAHLFSFCSYLWFPTHWHTCSQFHHHPSHYFNLQFSPPCCWIILFFSLLFLCTDFCSCFLFLDYLLLHLGYFIPLLKLPHCITQLLVYFTTLNYYCCACFATSVTHWCSSIWVNVFLIQHILLRYQNLAPTVPTILCDSIHLTVQIQVSYASGCLL